MSEAQPSRRILRSIGAILAGMIVGIALSIGTDLAMHSIGVFPPQDPAASGPWLLATGYRTIYGILASYIAARLAPDRPMQHALLLGAIDFLVSVLGVIYSWNQGPEFGPHWYPITLVVLALPAAWLGGKLCVTQLSSREAPASSEAP